MGQPSEIAKHVKILIKETANKDDKVKNSIECNKYIWFFFTKVFCFTWWNITCFFLRNSRLFFGPLKHKWRVPHGVVRLHTHGVRFNVRSWLRTCSRSPNGPGCTGAAPCSGAPGGPGACVVRRESPGPELGWSDAGGTDLHPWAPPHRRQHAKPPAHSHSRTKPSTGVSRDGPELGQARHHRTRRSQTQQGRMNNNGRLCFPCWQMMYYRLLEIQHTFVAWRLARHFTRFAFLPSRKSFSCTDPVLKPSF